MGPDLASGERPMHGLPVQPPGHQCRLLGGPHLPEQPRCSSGPGATVTGAVLSALEDSPPALRISAPGEERSSQTLRLQ